MLGRILKSRGLEVLVGLLVSEVMGAYRSCRIFGVRS